MKEWRETTVENQLARYRATELRRCLSCDYWMRSLGPDHRICNCCKPGASRLFARAGQRIGRTP